MLVNIPGSSEEVGVKLTTGMYWQIPNFANKFRMSMYRSVSYTHLDVYKRQMLYDVIIA